MSVGSIQKQDRFEIVPLSPNTIDACAEIAQHAPDPWQRDSLLNAMNDLNRWSFVATLNDQVAGFAVFLAVTDSADLEMLVVKPELRGIGIGHRLLMHGLVEMQNQHVEHCLLEVRVSNTTAQNLYKQVGFKTLSIRPGLYSKPTEDGLLMARSLTIKEELE